VIRTYLEWIADLPWSARAEAKDDIDAVSKKLDEDHFGLEDVKKRILEHMAVLQLAGTSRGSILCFAGPPGVGKTSLGQSIADATGRPFMRIALGGVRDEAEIRGHRRTYVGALPGRLVNAMRKGEGEEPCRAARRDRQARQSAGWARPRPRCSRCSIRSRTRPSPITTWRRPSISRRCSSSARPTISANLSAPLRDRLEIIEISGYTPDEKVDIAKQHLVPKQLKEHAIHEGSLTITDEALHAIVRDYTREAGVRQLSAR
jgi:ATP-dependent Lon protease